MSTSEFTSTLWQRGTGKATTVPQRLTRIRAIQLDDTTRALWSINNSEHAVVRFAAQEDAEPYEIASKPWIRGESSLAVGIPQDAIQRYRDDREETVHWTIDEEGDITIRFTTQGE